MAEDDSFSGTVGRSVAGFKEGLGIAQTMQQIEQSREDAKNKRQALDLQKGDMLTRQILDTASITDPKLRRLKAKRVVQTAQTLGVAMDPDMAELLTNDQYVPSLVSTLGQMQGLPDDDRLRAYSNAAALYGDAGEALKYLDSAADNISKQAAAAAKGATTPIDALKVANETRNSLRLEFQGSEDIFRNANTIYELASTKEGRESPFSTATAQIIFSKITDPGSVVREAEAANVRGISAGIAARIFQSIEQAKSGARLSPDQWRDLLSVVKIVETAEQHRIGERRESLKPMLSGITGLSMESVFPKFTVPRVFDFKGAFGRGAVGDFERKLASRKGAGGTQQAKSPIELAKERFAALPPEKQAKLKASFDQRIQALEQQMAASAPPAEGVE